VNVPSAPAPDAYLWVSEAHINLSEGYRMGDTEPYESYLTGDQLGRLFRDAQREHGRCVSRVYVDIEDGPAIPVGWVFVKRDEYEDSRPRYDDYGRRKPVETFLHETWITVHAAPDTVVRTPHFVRVGR